MSSVDVETEKNTGNQNEGGKNGGTVRERWDALLERLPKAPAWVTENQAIEQLHDYRVEVERRLEETLNSVLASLQVAQARDIGELSRQVRELEARVSTLESAHRELNH